MVNSRTGPDYLELQQRLAAKKEREKQEKKRQSKLVPINKK